MPSNKSTEHFVTLFDSNFLPMGMCLHASLMGHGQPFHLWILCMDVLVEQQLRQLGLPHVSLIPLQEVESVSLLGVKNGRTAGEYCWTLTPFTPQFVFDRNQKVERVTYLDADLFFFDSPQILLEEFEISGKQVLITEHAYAPEYDQTETCGKFCVQFITFRRTDGGLRVMEWWQKQCLQWCFNRFENGKFGDQKYLDDWPSRFFNEVHVLRAVERTLAPWNVRYFQRIYGINLHPAFYHFQALRIIERNKVLLYSGYRIGSQGKQFYKQYLGALRDAFHTLHNAGIATEHIPISPKKESWGMVRKIIRRLRGIAAYAKLANSTE
jgi:hypothetical protein